LNSCACSRVQAPPTRWRAAEQAHRGGAPGRTHGHVAAQSDAGRACIEVEVLIAGASALEPGKEKRRRARTRSRKSSPRTRGEQLLLRDKTKFIRGLNKKFARWGRFSGHLQRRCPVKYKPPPATGENGRGAERSEFLSKFCSATLQMFARPQAVSQAALQIFARPLYPVRHFLTSLQ
jgi:hypothetical protein